MAINLIATDSSAWAKVYGEPLVDLPQDLYIPPDALEVVLDAFEGPLDLLLYLIRCQNLDVLNIPMSEVTRQYMLYVDVMREKQLELAADYLLMAALLIEIKSRMLLPRPAMSQDDEQDPRAELVRRLLEYERMKLAAQQLDAMPRLERDFALVHVWLEQAIEKHPPEVSPDDLRQAWLSVAARARVQRHHRVRREELSVREHMGLILRRLQGCSFVAFEALFEVKKGLPEAVVTFLALLELARESLVEISQTEDFATIYVKLTGAGQELE